MKHLPMILKNCWRNRRRTILTILSIGVSLCLLGVLLAIYHAFYFSDPTPSQALRLITRNSISLARPMPQAYEAIIKKVPGVREVAIEDWFGGQYIDDRPEHMFARFAVDADKIFVVRSEIQMPEDQKAAFLRDRAGCIVGKPVADKQHFKLGDKITLKGDIYPFNLELTVRGIFEAVNSADVLYFSRETLEQSMLERQRGNAGLFIILANSADDVPRIESAVDEQFHNSPTQTKTESESAFSLSFVSFLGNVKAFLLVVCGAVMFTMLLVSANTIAMSVRERVREVGVMKVLRLHARPDPGNHPERSRGGFADWRRPRHLSGFAAHRRGSGDACFSRSIALPKTYAVGCHAVPRHRRRHRLGQRLYSGVPGVAHFHSGSSQEYRLTWPFPFPTTCAIWWFGRPPR